VNDGFRVDDAALAAHGDTVDALAARLRTAAGAAAPLGTAAYGVVGQVFAVAVVGATATASRSVARLADDAGALGAAVRVTGAGYRDAEQRAAAPFHGAPRR
jgi:hypothetical protein